MLSQIHDHIRQIVESKNQLSNIEIDYTKLNEDYETEYDRCMKLAEELNETERSLLQAEFKTWRVQRGEQDIEWFGRYYFSDYFENETPAFHHELNAIVDEAEANKEIYGGLVLAAPRGHTKSFRISFLKVIHKVTYKKKKFVVLISDTGTQAESMTSAIKVEFEENDRLREDFGDLVGETYGLKWTNGDFVVTFPKVDGAGNHEINKKGKPRPGYTCRIVARGTNAGMRGLKNRAYRPDLVIVDDGENDELVQTAAQRKKVWNWLTGAVIPMLHPTEGLFIVVGTVLHFDSMLSKLLAQPDIYLVKRYKALLDDGQPLWPSRFPLKRLMQLKQQLGSLKFNQEYLNNPIDEDTQAFKAEWLRFYTKNQISFKEDAWWILGERMALYQGVDPAISEKESADDFVIFTAGFSEQNKIILLDPYDDHLDFTAQPKAIIRKYQEWLPVRVGIETTAFGTQNGVSTGMIHGGIRTMIHRRGLIPNLVNPSGTKKYVGVSGWKGEKGKKVRLKDKEKKEVVKEAVLEHFGFTHKSHDVIDAYIIARVALNLCLYRELKPLIDTAPYQIEVIRDILEKREAK